MVTTQLTAPGICCGGCVATVKQTLGQFPGIQSVDASTETKVITLTYDPHAVDLAKVEEALAAKGYPVQK